VMEAIRIVDATLLPGHQITTQTAAQRPRAERPGHDTFTYHRAELAGSACPGVRPGLQRVVGRLWAGAEVARAAGVGLDQCSSGSGTADSGIAIVRRRAARLMVQAPYGSDEETS
jgi:hypothetical protein